MTNLFEPLPVKAKIGLSIVGSSRRNGKRSENDLYPTPRRGTVGIVEKELFVGSVWECACGTGEMSEVLKEYNLDVFSSDLINRGYGDATIDFLNYSRPNYDNIITNPPFSLANEFIAQAKKFANNKIAFLLPGNFSGSEGRFKMFKDREFPLKEINHFSRRLTINKPGYTGKNKGMMHYCWYVWDREHFGKPTNDWIY